MAPVRRSLTGSYLGNTAVSMQVKESRSCSAHLPDGNFHCHPRLLRVALLLLVSALSAACTGGSIKESPPLPPASVKNYSLFAKAPVWSATTTYHTSTSGLIVITADGTVLRYNLDKYGHLTSETMKQDRVSFSVPTGGLFQYRVGHAYITSLHTGVFVSLLGRFFRLNIDTLHLTEIESVKSSSESQLFACASQFMAASAGGTINRSNWYREGAKCAQILSPAGSLSDIFTSQENTAVSPDGSHLYYVRNGSVMGLNLRTGHLDGALCPQWHNAGGLAIAISPERQVLVVDDVEVAILVSLSNGDCKIVPIPVAAQIQSGRLALSVVVAAGGTRLVWLASNSSSGNDDLVVSAITSDKMYKDISLGMSVVDSISSAPDSPYVFVEADIYGVVTIKRVNVLSGNISSYTAEQSNCGISQVVSSSSGRYVTAVCPTAHRVFVVNTVTGREQTLQLPSPPVGVTFVGSAN